MYDLRSRINGKGSLWLPLFLDFISRIKIKSKEFADGPGPIVPYGAQELFLKHVCEGLDEDCHFFVTLKARQLGMTTIMLALDLFWLSLYPGLDGALILDSVENLAISRDTIKEMLESLPRSHRLDIVKNNRDFLSLSNGSRLQYLSAGKRKENKTFGISRAYSFVHCSEVGSWGDPNGVKHLITTLAKNNPNRLYIFESTAFGFNGWRDTYMRALRDGEGQRAMFIGWWAKDIYRHEVGTREYKTYWESHPHLTKQEREKSRIVKALYGTEIDAEQIAWYREMEQGYSEEMLQEKYPWYADEAFVATGKGFFSAKTVSRDMKACEQLAYAGYTCELGNNFMDMSVKTDMSVKAAQRREEVDLRIWDEPRRGAYYAMGMDPAFGSSDKADRTVISIWRAYSDKLIQVAEYATPEPTSQQAAWVMAYLAACYKDVVINIELNGPGEAVFREITNLKQQMRIGPLSEVAGALKVGSALDSIRWFLDRKVDLLHPSFAYHFRTNLSRKNTMFNRYRDFYNTEILIPRSIPLLEEMAHIQQDGDEISPAAGGDHKDDRVFAACLASRTWEDQMRSGLLARGITFERELAREKAEQEGAIPVDHMAGAVIVQNYFRQKILDADAEVRAKFRRGI